MSTLRSRWGSRSAKVVVGVVALGVTGLVASMALTGPATAGDNSGFDNYHGGWPTELVDGDIATTSRADRPSDQVIRLRARTVRDTVVDTGDAGFSPGDYSVFENKLFKRGEQVGRDSVRCMVNHRSVMCHGTLTRGSDNLAMAGTFFFRAGGPIQLAVTGGTGSYRDAAGTFTVRAGGKGPGNLYIIRLVD
ncbi:MAG: hypothetical protein M3Q87_04700 [Actinomycetota bacterium]|nr:hypothetical protein [Actinomycetota bacterium]